MPLNTQDYLNDEEEDFLPEEEDPRALFRNRRAEGGFVEPTGDHGTDPGADIPRSQPAVARTALETPPGPSAARQNPDAGEYMRRRDELTRLQQSAPTMSKPKWWQRLGAGAVGGMIGLSQSRGYNRNVNPAAATEEILHPGYRRRLADWQRQVSAAEAGAQGEQQKLSALERIQRINTDADLRGYQKTMAETRLARLRNQPSYKARFDEAKSSGASDEQAHVYASGGHIAPPKPVAPRRVQISQEVADKYGIMPDADGKYYAPESAIGSLVRTEGAPERPRQLVNVPPEGTVYDPDTRKPIYQAPARAEKPPAQANPMQFRLVESRKNDALADAEDEASGRIAGNEAKGIPPEDPDIVYRDLEKKKQRIQDAYEAEVSAVTGQPVAHRRYSKTARQQPERYTEAEVRRRAQEAGMDPEVLVKAAKSKNLIR